MIADAIPGSVREEQVKCLGCHAEMIEKAEETSRGVVSYDVCETCGAVWFDAGEMDAVVLQVYRSVEASSRDKAEEVTEQHRKCPRCGDQWMDKVYFLAYSDILLDHCRTCHGFWLDGGELDLINKNLSQFKRQYGPIDKGLDVIGHFLGSVDPY